MSLPDWSYVIAGLDPAISPAKGIPASERGNDIVSYKSKFGLIVSKFFIAQRKGETSPSFKPLVFRCFFCEEIPQHPN